MAKLVESLELSFWARATVLVPRYILALFLLHDHKSFDLFSTSKGVSEVSEQCERTSERTSEWPSTQSFGPPCTVFIDYAV